MLRIQGTFGKHRLRTNCCKRFDNDAEITKSTNITKNKYKKQTFCIFQGNDLCRIGCPHVRFLQDLKCTHDNKT